MRALAARTWSLSALAGRVCVPLALLFSLAPAVPAVADESISSSRYLTLTSIADPVTFATLRPGAPVHWQVGVAATTPDPAIIGLGLSATGPLAATLDIAVRACNVRWTGHTCPGTLHTLVAAGTSLASLLAGPDTIAGQPPAPEGVIAVGGMPDSEQRWLEVEVTQQPGGPSGSADLVVWAWASASDPSSDMNTDVNTAAPLVALAPTGSLPPLLPPLLAGGAVVMGAAIASSAAAAAYRRRARENAPGGAA